MHRLINELPFEIISPSTYLNTETKNIIYSDTK